MRTTLKIDDDLYRRVKAKAALEGRKVTDLVEDGLRFVLQGPALPAPVEPSSRVRLPLVAAGPRAGSLFAGMTQQEIHQRLADLQSEVDRTDHAPSV